MRASTRMKQIRDFKSIFPLVTGLVLKFYPNKLHTEVVVTEFSLKTTILLFKLNSWIKTLFFELYR